MTASGIHHATISGLTLPGVPAAPGAVLSATGRVLLQGEEFTVTPELYAETVDRNGVSWLDLDADAQLAKWGEIRFAPGPRPDALTFGGDDSSYRIRQWQRDLAYAQDVSDPNERRAALARVRAEFPEFGASHSHTLSTTRDRAGF
ncbi:hypothetical protein [Microbacterium sp. LWH3-1.2]|uniref:hypothetical protein n=1 Tax=Microbacterium sp. LWH3-1.2 TaxID=3135256 RepID=UPI00342E3F10